MVETEVVAVVMTETEDVTMEETKEVTVVETEKVANGRKKGLQKSSVQATILMTILNVFWSVT